MVDVRRSSGEGSGGVWGRGGGKRRSSSAPPPSSGSPTKRSEAKRNTKTKQEEAPVAAAADEEAGTSSWSAEAAGKSPAPLNAQKTLPPAATGLQAVEPKQRVPWARLISQNKQSSDIFISANEFSVGRSDEYDLKSIDVSPALCKLRRLEQPDRCQLHVTGKKGLVELNGLNISKDVKCVLYGGDKVAFCKLAFIFQPYNRLPISASATLPPRGSQIFKDELKQGILGPGAIQVTLDNFPYYLSENTKSVLLLAAAIHMEKKFIHTEKKLTKILSGVLSLNQRILLSGPSVNEIRPDSSGDQEVETLGIDELMEVISEESISSTLIVLLNDVEKTLTGRTELHAPLGNELPHGVLIIGSHTTKDNPKDKESGVGKVKEKFLRCMFHGKIRGKETLAWTTFFHSCARNEAA